jgi:MSHA pilin protein MshC
MSRVALRVRGSVSGFTLVELVVVIILVTILAVVALPRLNTRTFDSVGFYDEVRATVRFAQKDAVAKRRTVCLAFTATSVTLTYSPSRTPVNCSANLVSPRGATPFVVTAASGVAFAPTPANFSFDPLGRPSLAQVITITGDGSRSFSVEAETGYVHP